MLCFFNYRIQGYYLSKAVLLFHARLGYYGLDFGETPLFNLPRDFVKE